MYNFPQKMYVLPHISYSFSYDAIDDYLRLQSYVS